jgi:hypothetical protein
VTGDLLAEPRTRAGLRVKGRTALQKRVALLVIATHRFAAYRAVTDEDRRWAARLADRLNEVLEEAGGETRNRPVA